MNETMTKVINEALEAKKEMDRAMLSDKPAVVIEKTSANETLAALQRTATSVQKEMKDAEWAGITSYNEHEIPPLMMAKLYAALPWGPNGTYLTIPQALMLAIVARRRNLNPEEGDIFILPSGRIGTSLQGMLKEAKLRGNQLSAPFYTDVTRPWPKGVVLTRKDTSTKPWRDVDFDMPEEPGVTCSMQINGAEVSYTAWLIPWFMGGNPNWYSRMDWMLRVRAQTRALSLGTGIAVSEEIADTDSVSSSPAVRSPEAKAPKSTPFGGSE